MAWASCGREKLALLQLPVLVKYRIALVGVPVPSDSSILSRYIDSEWADSLVGLSMKVPDYWWKEYTTHSLNDGRIVSFDVATQRWHLLLQTQEDGEDLYPMAYAAVCEYSDKQSSSFQDFVLPVEPIFEGGDEIDGGGTRYKRSSPEEWTQVQEGGGR
jgi:hypothetical protein